MRLQLLDFDELFDENNVITSLPIDPKTRRFLDDGIYSSRIFGSMYGFDHSCDCGYYSEQYTVGLTCPECETVVVRNESSMNQLGWIDLGEYKIINPLLYPILERYIGPRTLERYVEYNTETDIHGNLRRVIDGPMRSDVIQDFISMGVHDIVNRIEEVLDRTKEEVRKNNRIDDYRFLKKNLRVLTISKIPVFSHKLRPAVFVKEELVFDKVNTAFNQIVALNYSLQDLGEDRIELNYYPMVNNIQIHANGIFEYLIDSIAGKRGYIRNSMIGNRLNFSSRCVIVPLKGPKNLDEIHVPYKVMIEIFRFHLMNFYQKVKNCSYEEAEMWWRNATVNFDELAYNILDRIKNKLPGGFKALLNRNPTLNLGSILQMRITEVKKDPDDLTISVPNNILNLIAGDYDGDVLNLFLLMTKETRNSFDSLNPRNLVVSNDDGSFNRDLNLSKDHVLGIHTLVTSKG